jgi:hypothetical protein
MLGIGSALEMRQSLKGCTGSNPVPSATLGYSVMVSTKHFDCFSLGSSPSNPTIISGSRGVRFISLALDARARRFESCLPDE